MSAAAVNIDPEVLHGPTRARLRYALGYAILAPSTHNTQPWIFKLSNTSVEVYADRSRALSRIDPNHRELTISVGAAVEHLRIAMACLLIDTQVQLAPDSTRPDLMARLVCVDECEPSLIDQAMFSQITKRHTVRGPMADSEVPPETIDSIVSAATSDSVQVTVIQNADELARLAANIQMADETLFADPRYRREYALWVRSNYRGTDGVPAPALGMTGLAATAIPWAVEHATQSQGFVQRDVVRVLEAPVAAIVSTSGDGPVDWLRAGMAITRLVLAASEHEVRNSFFFQPIHLPWCRRELREATLNHGYPQLIVRLGYAAPGEPTPRRPLQDVLVETREGHGSVRRSSSLKQTKPEGGRTL